jgi:hypothetical protein
MSYEAILEGLQERFETVAGIVNVLDYEPTAIHDYPTLYSLLDEWSATRSGQVRSVTYRTLHRLLFRWQDNEMAAKEMIPFVDAIPAAVEADRHLGGRLISGLAVIDEGEVNSIVLVGGTECLALDFYSTVVEKGA